VEEGAAIRDDHDLITAYGTAVGSLGMSSRQRIR
jgi:hypothetical protein